MRQAGSKRPRAVRGAALVWAVAAGLAGCGKPPEPLAPFLPLVPGGVWVYRVETPDAQGELRVEARGPVEVAGHEGPIFLVVESPDPALGWGDSAGPVGYVVDEGFVARLEALGWDQDRKLRFLGPRGVAEAGRASRVLPLDPHPGDHWTQEVRVFEPGAPMIWEGRVRASDPIEVPAGRFDDVIEVETLLRRPSGEAIQVYRDVYARGVGRVYATAYDPRLRAPTVRMRLLRYGGLGTTHATMDSG